MSYSASLLFALVRKAAASTRASRAELRIAALHVTEGPDHVFAEIESRSSRVIPDRIGVCVHEPLARLLWMPALK